MKLKQVSFNITPFYWCFIPTKDENMYGKEEQWYDIDYVFLCFHVSIQYGSK